MQKEFGTDGSINGSSDSYYILRLIIYRQMDRRTNRQSHTHTHREKQDSRKFFGYKTTKSQTYSMKPVFNRFDHLDPSFSNGTTT